MHNPSGEHSERSSSSGGWGGRGGQRRLHELIPELNHNRCEQLAIPKKGAFQPLGTTGWSKTVLQWIAETQTLLAKDPDPMTSCAEIRLE